MSYLLIGLLMVLVGSVTNLWLLLAGGGLLAVYVLLGLRHLFR